MYKASSIFTNINELPFNNEEERTKLRIFFAYNDATKVEAILSTITKDEAKVEFLRGYVDKSRDEHPVSSQEMNEIKKKVRFLEVELHKTKCTITVSHEVGKNVLDTASISLTKSFLSSQ
ncbi:1404_t:CDS:2, partial [Funneliformis mosseae]